MAKRVIEYIGIAFEVINKEIDCIVGKFMLRKFIIKGLVQGIGYRPFVAKLADELNIDGFVRNTGGIVTVVAKADSKTLDEFYNRLKNDVPTGGFITAIEVLNISEADKLFTGIGFNIIESDVDMEKSLPLIPADICTCDNCKKELFDKSNRRYLHPFISCTICGPRYSIIEHLPYDRQTITMSDFLMCDDCKKEYQGKKDIRRHAQTIACKKCGPRLKFTEVSGNEGILAKNNCQRITEREDFENLENNSPEAAKTVEIISNGGIIAIKDIGGYHLVCDPFNEKAVANLRTLKHREAKAFAVMFFDMDSIKEYCIVNEQEQKLLESPARPIVLLKKKATVKHPLASNVCLNSPSIGAMLPCNPLQMILTRTLGPLIMTSANSSGDVLETDDTKMLEWMKERANSKEMSGISLAILSHNRRILHPLDDSVLKVVAKRQQFIRRARGYVPAPISVDIDKEIFAAGGDLKSSFCFVKNGLAYVSQYLGDMESVSCQSFYKNEQSSMENLFGFEPEIFAIDKHPAYFSSNIYRKNGLPIVQIQHHKAHVAAVIAEHNLKGRVLGFAFDGTGFGDDGTVWGSEVFLWDGKTDFERVAHLTPVTLIGGDQGAKNCDTILSGFLHNYGLSQLDKNDNKEIICAAIDNNINTIRSSSMGRLFDAVSAMLDICHYNSYEGQAPVELEYLAAKVADKVELKISDEGSLKQLFIDIDRNIKNGVAKEKIARGFILAVSEYIVEIAKKNIEKLDDSRQIVLSGGTFLNSILLESVISKLESANFSVYISEQLPPGDGSICLGQAWLAGR